MPRSNQDKTGLDLTIGEVIILSSASAPEGTHGYALKDALGEEKLRNGTIYRRLGALAGSGYLGGVTAENGSNPGRPRVTYRLTEEGQTLLNEALACIDSVAEQNT